MNRTRSLLVDDMPLLVYPTLACAIGDRPAMFVQQIHYWLVNKRQGKFITERDGFEWVYNTLKDWLVQFPFWTERELRYVIKQSVEAGAIITCQPEGSNRRTWYRVNYHFIQKLEEYVTRTGTVQGFSSDKFVASEIPLPDAEKPLAQVLPQVTNLSLGSDKFDACIDKEDQRLLQILDSVESHSANEIPPSQPPEKQTKRKRKAGQPKTETALFNDMKTAWFALADTRESNNKRSPHRMITPADFKQFKSAIEAIETLARMYEWDHVQTVQYTIEAATHQLDSKWWKEHATTPYELKHTAKSLQGWWTQIKKPSLAKKQAVALPAPSTPPSNGHIQQVTEENQRRVREHQRQLEELAEKGQAPLGYRPVRKNPFQRE